MMIKNKLEKSQIILENNLENNADEIFADKRIFVQIIYHLLDNAIKFSPKGGMVTLNLESEDDAITVKISDNGIGIPKEKMTYLFSPFNQFEEFLTKRFSGIGMGLALTKYYVETHGGKIWVESEEGKGSSFYFSLPSQKSI
ncbi:signal transduction histidine kinase [Methanohalophilus levihalophilus]|uniref:sensor histidine kinase n=1 Tax=Methanohalophilus levihalophilus TaxID=1431282 RepID=UPI001AE6AC75|nr:ATP-binding protein [Methanohalophilus levihalophilus]MBP2029194.1 signal transduction histidine kinase [Methanohalophilus levihalophilus]